MLHTLWIAHHVKDAVMLVASVAIFVAMAVIEPARGSGRDRRWSAPDREQDTNAGTVAGLERRTRNGP